MQPNVPNKLASIFVTGGLALVLISFFSGKDVISMMHTPPSTCPEKVAMPVPEPGQETHEPDGSQETHEPDGSQETHEPDGSTESPTSGALTSARFLIIVLGGVTVLGAIMQAFGHVLRNFIQRCLAYRGVPPAPCPLIRPERRPGASEETPPEPGEEALSIARRAYVGLSRWSRALVHLIKGLIEYLLYTAKRWLGMGLAFTNSGYADEVDQWARLYVKLSDASKAENQEAAAFLELYETNNETASKATGSGRFPNTAHPVVPRQCVSLFFRFAGGTHLSWVLQHYATYYLTTDMFMSLFVIGLCAPLTQNKLPFSPLALYDERSMPPGDLWGIPFEYLWPLAILVALSGLLVISVHRYYYTYNAVVRFCCAILSKPSPYFPNVIESGDSDNRLTGTPSTAPPAPPAPPAGGSGEAEPSAKDASTSDRSPEAASLTESD